MTKTTTNLLGIIIVILAGIYFFSQRCGFCGSHNNQDLSAIEKVTHPVVAEMDSSPSASHVRLDLEQQVLPECKE